MLPELVCEREEDTRRFCGASAPSLVPPTPTTRRDGLPFPASDASDIW